MSISHAGAPSSSPEIPANADSRGGCSGVRMAQITGLLPPKQETYIAFSGSKQASAQEQLCRQLMNVSADGSFSLSLSVCLSLCVCVCLSLSPCLCAFVSISGVKTTREQKYVSSSKLTIVS